MAKPAKRRKTTKKTQSKAKSANHPCKYPGCSKICKSAIGLISHTKRHEREASTSLSIDPQSVAYRPPKYTDPQVMDAAIQQYFIKCDTPTPDYNKKPDKEGNYPTKLTPYTLAGMAYSLGFAEVKAIDHYENRNKNGNDTINRQFGHVLKRARLCIETQRNVDLFTRSNFSIANMFYLKAKHGYIEEEKRLNYLPLAGNITINQILISMQSPDEIPVFGGIIDHKTKLIESQTVDISASDENTSEDL